MNDFHMRLPRAGLLRLVALAAAGAVALAACSNDSSPDPESTAETGEAADFDGSSISMTVPITESGTNPYVAIAEAYTLEFPEREVVVNTLATDGYAQAVRTQLQAGNADDLIYTTPGAGNLNAMLPIAEAGLLEPLTGTSAESTIPESGRAAFYLDGELYGQALDLTVVASVVNETAMQEDGFEFPADYAGLLDLCAEVAALGKSVYVVAGSVPANAGLTAMTIAGSRVYAETPDWNARRTAGEVTFADTEGWADTLQAIVEMNDAGCFQPGVEGGDFSAITTGMGQAASYAAFAPAGSAVQLSESVPGSSFVMDVMPGVTEETTLLYASSNNALALTAASENKPAAKAFLDWLAQAENRAQYAEIAGLLPVGDVDADDLPAHYRPIAERLANGEYQPLPNQAWASGEVYDALGTGFQGLITGQTTVEDVLAAMDAAWDR